MIFKYNNYKKLEQSQLFLANPQKNYIGELSGVKNLHLKINFGNMSEATFTIYRYENKEENQFYDKIENKRLVEIQYVGWFQIIKVEDQDDCVNPFKNVSCVSLENQLTSKKVTGLDGSYALYDYVNPNNSLLHIISASTGWKISHVDSELYGKYRTFKVDNDKVYGFLTSTVATSFECIFDFNTYDKSISCYKLENAGELTDITISDKNILQKIVKESSGDKIITKLRVLGSDDVDITDVNPTATDYIINVDYYMNTDWMSQGLIDAIKAYKVKYNSHINNYESTIAVLKTKQAELTVLNEELEKLQESLSDATDKQGDIISSSEGAPNTSDDQYQEYQEALANILLYTNQVNNKKTEITAKESEIASVQAILNVITNDLAMNNNYTKEQLDELNVFLTEDAEYQDSTFTITENMTNEQILAMKQELINNGYYELSLASKPQYTYKTTASNLFSIQDDSDNFISYDTWREKCEVGNLITIKVRDDYYITIRLLTIDFDFNKLEDIDLTFSDLPRNTDKQSQYAEIIALASKTSSSYSFSKFGYEKAASITDDVQKFMSGAFNATLNAMKNNDNVETEFGKFGIRNRQWLQDQNKYSDYQSWWNQNTLLFTDSNWKDSKAGIGVFTDAEGNKTMSVIADVLAGNIVISSKLNVTNSSGSYTITDKYGFQAKCGVFSVGINPSTASEIFNVKVDGLNALYVDAVNKRLVLNGEINASSGTLGNLNVVGVLTGGTLQGSTVNTNSGNIGGWNISDNGLTSYNTNATINLYNNYNHAMQISYNGLHLYNHYSGNNEYLGGAIAIYNSSNGSNGLTLCHSNQAEYLALGFADASSPYSGMPVYMDLIYTRNGYGSKIPGFYFYKDVYINNSIAITASNVNSYVNTASITPSLTADFNINYSGGINGASVTYVQTYFARQSALESLADRVSALESK